MWAALSGHFEHLDSAGSRGKGSAVPATSQTPVRIHPTITSTLGILQSVHRIHIDIDIDISEVVDPPEGSVIYTIGLLEFRIGASTFGSTRGVWVLGHR